MKIAWYLPNGIDDVTYSRYLTQGIGGSEAHCLLFCRELANQGHDVTIYGNVVLPEGEPVRFLHRNAIGNHDADVLVWHRKPEDEYLPLFEELQYPRKILYQTDQYVNGSPAACKETWQKYLYAPAHKIINFSYWAKEYICAQYDVPAEKVIVFRNGLETEYYRDFTEAKYNADVVRFIYCSLPNRGLDNAMEIFPIVSERLQGKCELHIYGDYTMYGLDAHADAIRKYHAAWFKANPNAFYHGGVGHCELARAQLDAAILFYPTFFRENCSSSIIECMLAGCVPVTSWLGGIPELVFTTVDGIVLHVADDVCFGIAGDEAKWEYHWRYIDAIMNLCTDRELLAEYGLMARHLAHLRFNIKKQTKYLEAILA